VAATNLKGQTVFASRRNVLFSLVALAGLGQLGCSSSSGGPPPFEGPPIRAVCTTTIVADVVQRVGGDRVTVQTLMGPGVDPHKYLPAPSDRAKLEQAHLVFYNGLHLEGKMVDTFEKAGGRMRAVAVTKTIDRAELRRADADGGEFDPHVWFDVRLWQKTVECVRDELSTLDPGGADVYRSNAEAYLAELDALDREVREKLSRVPTERRILVTSHDAFGYFGRAYGFQVKGLQGVSTASETGTKDVQELAVVLGRNKVPAVFTETSVAPDGLKAVLETTRRDWKHEVRLVGGENALYSDALGPPGSPAATYPGMVRHNVDTIVKALAP
jgi:manganese/zinc/iron transport system substrate-binding protein